MVSWNPCRPSRYTNMPIRAPIRQNAFFAVRGAFFELFSVGSERSARCLCTPGTSRFRCLLRLAFLQERSEHLKLKNKQLWVEVFTEDPRPEVLCLTLCVIAESIGEHRTRQRSASVSMRVCNLQFVKLGWEKCEREIRWQKKKHAIPQPPERAESAGGVNVVA